MMIAVPRNAQDKPLIAKPGTGTPVYEGKGKNTKAYFRASSYADVLEDKTALTAWKLRMAVKGLTVDESLFEQARRTELDQRVTLGRIADDAITAAGGGAAAKIGTALHTLTEALDRGEDVSGVPDEYQPDLDAYVAATAGFGMDHIERFMVCDELEVAGTPDRVFTPGLGYPTLPMIGDLKTSNSSLDYQGIKFATQLAIYAHSAFYDPATGEREHVDINQQTAMVYHMPAGKGTCDLIEVDIAAGWRYCLLARGIREARRNARKLLTKVG